MTLTEFVNKYFDQPNVGNTPENKGQCVGLSSVAMDELGIQHEWGNAKDLLANADTSKFEIVLNSINAIPLPGDIFVCGSNWGGGDGHTGLIIYADIMKMVWFEQNNPTGSRPILATHDYDNRPNGLIGWLHPINGFVSNDTTLIDQLRADRDKNWQLYQDQVQHSINQEDSINEKQKTIDILTKENLDDKTTINMLQGEKQAALDDYNKSQADTVSAKNDVQACKNELSIANGLLNNRKDLYTWSWLERFNSLFRRAVKK